MASLMIQIMIKKVPCPKFKKKIATHFLSHVSFKVGLKSHKFSKLEFICKSLTVLFHKIEFVKQNFMG